jgi:magnesium chelatase accessory protein
MTVERRAPAGRCSPLAVISDLLKNRPLWDRDGRDWPNRRASRFVQAGGLRWHVQQLGRGPLVLLVHGTGAATHSWGVLAPLLARRFTVVAPDLPGHGFTETPPSQRLSLPGMAEALGELLGALGISPALAIGHSAGAAVLARMSLDGLIAPRGLISLNGALLPLRGAAGHLFSPLAKLLAVNPLVPRLFALRAADRAVVEGLLRSTGSTLQPVAVDCYARLLRNPGHVAGALAMMANWDLRPLERDLPGLGPALVLVVGDRDRTVPPTEAGRVRALVPTADLVTLPGLGHLAHEERPERIAELVTGLACEWGVLSAS